MTDIIKAIIEIKSDAQVSVNANQTDLDVAEITWHDGNPTNITNQQILDKQAEMDAIFAADQYKRDRTHPRIHGDIGLVEPGNIYPSVAEQLDMQWHDKKDGTTTWEDAIQAVKDAHPKP